MIYAGLDVAKDIADCHLTRLKHLLASASNGHYGDEKALKI